MIPYGRQDITEADIATVVDVLQSDWLTQGPMVPRFEEAMVQKIGAKYAVAVNSATSALHIACLALDLGPGDWLWTSPNTFVASANCGLYCGAQVDFVDIDRQTYNMSVAALAHKLEQAERLGKLPKIVIPVHFAGQSCDMVSIRQLSQRYGFKIIEDASHAIGGQYKGKPIGCGDYSDITVFSFHPVKIITTGEGGMAVTNHANLAERMQRLRSHGITRDAQQMQGTPLGPWYYEQIDLGFNYRMTDIQAALGVSQLGRLDQYILRRHNLANHYHDLLSDLPVVLPCQHANTFSAFHLYVIQLDSASVLRNRGQVFDCLRQGGVGVNIHYIPVYRQPYYKKMGFNPELFVETEQYYNHAMTLPLFYDLNEAQQLYIVTKLKEALQ